MLLSAIVLMQEKGIEAMSLSDVIEHANAPRGSIYHHFPGGKAELVEEAITIAGNAIGEVISSSDDPKILLERTRDFSRERLLASNFEAGCPIAAATLDGSDSPAARNAASKAFTLWQQRIAEVLILSGRPADEANAEATLTISAIEGSILLCRAQRSTLPLETTIESLIAHLERNLQLSHV